jgi:hypothetical protein
MTGDGKVLTCAQTVELMNEIVGPKHVAECDITTAAAAAAVAAVALLQ